MHGIDVARGYGDCGGEDRRTGSIPGVRDWNKVLRRVGQGTGEQGREIHKSAATSLELLRTDQVRLHNQPRYCALVSLSIHSHTP